jgi:hypothetical protein
VRVFGWERERETERRRVKHCLQPCDWVTDLLFLDIFWFSQLQAGLMSSSTGTLVTLFAPQEACSLRM